MDAFIGEIRLFPYVFAPVGWLLCDGSKIQIQQYPALYAVIVNTYGGDLKTYFNLPNLLGRVAVAAGDDPVDILDPLIGASGGINQVTLSTAQLPSHNHFLVGANLAAASRSATPAGNYLTGLAQHISGTQYKVSLPFVTSPDVTKKVTLNPGTLAPFSGAGGAHENRQPVLGLGWYICNDPNSVFPSRPD